MIGTDAQVRIRATMDIGDVVSNVGTIQKTLSKLKLPDNIGENLNKNISSFYKEYEKYQKKVADGIKTQGDYNQIEKSLNRLKALYGDIDKDLSKTTKLKADDLIDIGKGDFKRIADEISSVIKSINNVKIDTNGIKKFTNEIESLTKSKTVTGDTGILNRMIGHLETGNITEAKKELIELQKYADKVATRKTGEGKDAKLVRGTMGEEKYKQLQSALSAISAAFDKADADAAPFIQRLNELQSELAQTKQTATGDFLGNANKFKEETKNVEKVTDSLKRLHQEEYSFNRQAQDIDRQIQTYFGLSQMIRKVGDIARDAFNTVKELDAAMVETAVVTNFSVGDMWDMLPTYTKNANQLGSTIKDVYEAATLYYQQGLNQTQSMGLANETLKMARIGGLEATDATNMMTAALRGFNMELNQTSAQRINDVYSELAAITAADTKEIGSAMERTASIADSANMEFETTSAFLAQMIETTREAPENLGTAMKTIIARFQEMKTDPTKLVDSEGVAMDANRVDTALKTIGVNLTNTKGEFRDLDDVFLEISEKWDSLSQGQQRYIATIAAGARQQSRFIAMMQNYERVKELVDAANNSAGASQKQFEKTLTSMSAKLNRLKNAWDQFTMGLLNNKILKGAVDGLTGVFTVVNKIINVLGSIPPSPFEGITKSALTLVSTLGMLQLGKKTARGAIFAGAGWWKNEGTIAENFKSGWGPRREKQNKEPINQKNEYWNRVESRLTSNAKERVIKTPIDVDTYLRKIDTSDLDVRVKDRIEQELDKIGNEPITEDVQIKINNIIDQDAQGTESLHITDDMVNGIPKIDQFEGKINKLAGKVGQVGDLFQQLGSSIGGPFGNALSTVGSLLTSLSITLDATATSFMANFTAELQAAIGADANTAATLRMQIAQAGAAGTAKALGVALWSSLGPMAAIAAAIGLVIGAYKLLDAAIVTEKERLEETNDAAAKASEAFDLANQELSELRDSISSVRENEAAFDNLVVGTAAFNEQLVNANQQISELINKYPMLMDEGYVSTDKNGLMHITDQGLQAVEDYQKQIQAHASAINIVQSADLAALEKTQKAQQLYRDWGNSNEDHKKNIERANLLKQQAEAEKEVARQNAINATLIGTEVKNVETLSAVYTGLYEDKRKAAEQDVDSLDKNSIRQKYADYHGYTYDQSTKKIKDVEGNDVEYDDKILKDEVIEQTVLLDFEENAGSLEKTLGNLDTVFNNALNESFKNVEGADTFISDILSSNIEVNNDILEEVLKNPEELRSAAESLSNEEIAAVLGVSEKTVSSDVDGYKKQVGDLLFKKAGELAETQSKSYTELAEMMAQSSGKTLEQMLQSENQDDIASQIDKLTAQQATTLSTIGKTLEENVGAEAMKTFIDQASGIYLSGTQKTVEEFDSILEGISWESPTSRLAGYNEAIKSSDSAIQSWGKSMRSSANEANLLGESFDEFLGGDWGELSENADEFKNSMGEIDGAGILKASEQSRTLKAMLDSGEVSATGLAEALQGVEDGSISQVNSTVLQLLSSLNRLQDAALEAHNIIENFDPGIDTGEGEDFVMGNAEKAKEYYDNGEWGNQQLQNYIKLAAGTEKWNETLKKNDGDLQKTTSNLMKYVTTFKDGFQPAWDQMISDKNINGKKLSDAVDNAIKDGRIDEKLEKPFKDFKVSWDKEGFMDLNLGDMTTSELETYFQEIYGVSQEYAKLLMQDLANYDGEISAKLAANDLNETIKSDAFQTNNLDNNNNLTLSNADVQSFATVKGIEVSEALNMLSEAAGRTVKTFDVVDEQGSRLTNYSDLLNDYATTFFKVGEDGVKGLFKQTELLTQGQLDAAKLISDAQSHGMDETQSMGAAYEAYKMAQQSGESMLYNGMELKDGLASLDDFSAEIQSLTESGQWVTVGQTIGQQIVSALQTSSFLEQMRSGQTAAAFSDGKFNEGGFSQVIESIVASNESVKQQQQDVVSYLQQSQAEFAKMSPEDQTAALQGIVNKLNDLNFTPDQISSAINQGLGINLGTNANQGGSLTGEQGQVKLVGDTQSLQTQLDGLVAKPKIEPDLTPFQTSLDNLTGAAKVQGTFIGFRGAASGQNNPNSAFHRIGTMARGSKEGYTISRRPTLTGEEGEELVWEPKQNRAYMVGSNGPQFANISKDAVVWNAKQTKRIKKNSNTVGLLGTGAKGISSFGTMAGGNASGVGGSYKIPGTVDVDAVANIMDTIPPDSKPEIPVKAKLEVEGSGGGLLNRIKGLFGKGKEGPSIKVNAEAASVTVPEGVKPTVQVEGEIAELNNKAGKLSGVTATATVTNVIKKGKVTGEPVQVRASAVVSGKASGQASTATVKTKADSTAQKSINSIKRSGAVLIKTKADNAAQKAINSIKGKDVTIHIKPSFEGTWTKNATVHVNHAAKGQNNYIAHRTTPSFGSAASGRYGRLGPKGKGGLTLTGEKGFEIAWLPDESRSMILGAEGPQMLDLPSNAVVYTHEQSKKIIKQKSIPAGSHSRTGRRNQGKSSNNNNNNNSTKKKKDKKESKKSDKGNKSYTKTTTKILEKPGKINLLWWNMTKKVEATQREIDKITKNIKKEVPKIGASLKSIAPELLKFSKKTTNQINYNTEMRNRAQSGLNTLDKGNKSVDKKVSKAQSNLKKAQTKLQKAEKKKNKKSIKKQKKNVKKAKKELSAVQTGENYGSISYEQTKKVTKKKKGQKAKTTKKKVTKKEKVNLAPFIYFDKESGAYQVNYNAINKKYGKNQSKAKAVGDAATKKIEDLISKRNTAEDNITKAQEALEELSKEVAQAFLTWKSELTEVYDLTQRIANESSFTDRFDSQIEMDLAALKAGFGSIADTISNAQSVLARKNDILQKQIEDQQQMIGARQRELEDALSIKDEQERIDIVKNMSDEEAGSAETKKAALEQLEDEKLIASSALGYITNLFRDIDGSVQYNIDWDRFNKDRATNPINDETYGKIKDYLDDINSKTTDFNDSIKTQTDFIAQVYNTLEEYQDYIVDFEGTIIKGVEEQIDSETENLKKLSDSLSDNLKDLLDEVKRKLDERRQQEDNAKTEKDISQKQQRLAALRADTSGGHQVEIAQLEKEIADAQQSYQRTLEDQLLEKLQQQADNAQKQRERQIELAETSNELAAETNKELVNLWLSDPVRYQENLKKAWLEANDFDEMGIAEQAQFLNKWPSVFSELMTAVEQSGFNSANGTFKNIGTDTSTLVNLVTQLVNEKIGREEDTASAFGAQKDPTNRNVGTISDYAINSENAKFLKDNFNVKASFLKDYGFTAEHLIGNDVNNPIYSASELREGGFEVQDLLSAGLSIGQLKEGNYEAKDFHKAGILDINELMNSGFEAQDLRQGGYTVQDFKNNNISDNLIFDTFNPQEIKDSKLYTANDVYNKEIAYDKVKGIFDLHELANAGYQEARAELKRLDENARKAADAKRKADEAAAKKAQIEQYKAAYSKAKKAKDAEKDWGWAGDGSTADKYYSFLLRVGSSLSADQFKTMVSRGKELGYGPGRVAQDLANTKPLDWGDVLKAAKKAGYKKSTVSSWSTDKNFKKALKSYKTGGLASYTGPAWLDGTPSKPELVLNAQDTKNFLGLRDVLQKAVGSANSVTNSTETAMYEININVDHINNDYDVDKIASRIKKDIIKDAGYRNVTQVRKFR